MSLFQYRATHASALMLASLILSGCGGAEVDPGFAVVPAQGVVMQNGAPLPNATISFIPAQQLAPGYYGCGGVTDAEGKFTLTVGTQEGAVPGSYKVIVSKLTDKSGNPLDTASLEEGMDLEQLKMQGQVKEAIPPKFSNPNKSILAIDIPNDGSSDLKLEISS